MLLTISTSHTPATDLGYLLHKHPGKVQEFQVSGGVAHVFYPAAGDRCCEAALLLEIDPVGLVRGRGDNSLDQYVNDRPYVASSFMSVAIATVFKSALNGVCKDREELVKSEIPLVAKIASLPCRGGEEVLRRLFEPLGYGVELREAPLDSQVFPGEGSGVFAVTLSRTCTLSDLLTHLYVLLPVLDGEKHYYVGDEEVEKLLRFGEGWLASHPERELIAARYLRHRRSLIADALDRLREETAEQGEAEDEPVDPHEEVVERTLSLHEQRHGAVLAALRAAGAASVLDLGCGEGRLVAELLKDTRFTRIVGVEVSYRVLERAASRLRLETMPENRRKRVELLHGSLVYRDKRLEGFDAAAVVEVIEHLDEFRLAAFERVVFEFARPRTVVVTTPNREYNVKWETLEAGKLRHHDHRFEWTRAEFKAWAEGVCTRHGYAAEIVPVGPVDAEVGAPSQMGVFRIAGSS